MTIDALFAGPWGPILIFGLRIVDVSMATIRMLLIMRSHKLLVPLIGFFEVIIWIVAVGSAIRNLESIWHLLGYAGGFLGPLVLGATLDLVGGPGVLGWGVAFGHVTVALLLGALAFVRLRPADLPGDRPNVTTPRARRAAMRE